jgi:prepilin-type N-terminal cleavage/methylation domain-containing protein
LPTREPANTRRGGLSLLEVMLAIAILGGCVAVIGELVRLGSRHAEEVRLLTTAQLLCESKIEEIEAGVIAPEAITSAPFETTPDWFYSVTINALDQEELMEVRVTVEQAEATRNMPFTFTLVRWVLDPTLEESSGELIDSTTTDATGLDAATSGSQGVGDVLP